MSRHPVVEALTEEQVRKLEAGERIAVATELREPLTGDISTSFNVLEIQMSSKGTINHLDEQEDLIDEFPDVHGLESLIKDE